MPHITNSKGKTQTLNRSKTRVRHHHQLTPLQHLHHLPVMEVILATIQASQMATMLFHLHQGYRTILKMICYYKNRFFLIYHKHWSTISLLQTRSTRQQHRWKPQATNRRTLKQARTDVTASTQKLASLVPQYSLDQTI